MNVATIDRDALLEQYGRWFGEERFAIAFTSTTEGEDAKRVTTAGWDKTAPLVDGDYGAAYVSTRGKTKNPVVVLRPSNLIVLECDTEEDLIRIDALELPQTITVRSSKPYKRHYYYRPPADLEQIPYVAFRFESGKLTADSGRYFLVPPSIHPTGAVYAFLPERGPHETDIAELDLEVYRQLADQAKVETDALTEAISFDPSAKVRAGQRGDRLFRYASMLRRWGLPYQQILDMALQWNEMLCDPPITEQRVKVQVDGAMKKRGGQELEYAASHPLPDDDPRPETEPQPKPEPHPLRSWQPINLAAPEHAVKPDPPSILDLLYHRKRHVISGPPEANKTLVAYILAITAMRQGVKVAILDFEMGTFAARLLLEELGATLTEIETIYFVTPDEPPPDGLHAIIAHQAGLVIIDAAAGAYDATDLDDNARKDAEVFARQWIRPLWLAGISTLLIDHVVKNNETRGKFTIGSERKVGQADIHLGLEAIEQLTRGTHGIVKVHVHKDRPGFLKRPHAALFELASDPVTHSITWTVKDPHPTDEETGQFRPTVLMEKLSRHIQNLDEPASRTNIERDVKGKAEWIRVALDLLEEEGHIDVQDGPRKSRMVTHKVAYREDADTHLTTPSHPVPTPSRTGSVHPVPSSLPLQRDEDGDDVKKTGLNDHPVLDGDDLTIKQLTDKYADELGDTP